MSNKLVVYYSRTDENYVNGRLQHLTVGNTEVAASYLAEHLQADLFQIEQIHPYSKGYNDCIAEAQADQRRNARPELKEYPEDIAQYDEIYLGYPNYWGTMPMAVFTFLEHFDFSGKTIYPFCTHEGSGMGHSEADLKLLCPSATVEKGIPLQGGRIQKEVQKLDQWI